MKFFLLFLALAAPVSARIGDSRPQLLGRYGTPVIDTATAPEFRKSGLWIRTSLLNDSCQFISFTNAIKPGSSEPMVFSGPQLSALIEAAAPGRKWVKEGQNFKTQDGILTATVDTPGIIKIQTKEYLDNLAAAETGAPKTEPAPPQPPKPTGPAPTRVVVDAKTSSAGASRDKKWATYWGSYDRDIYRDRLVSITMRASTGGTAIVEVHWIGSEVGQPGGNKVVDLTKQQVTLPAADAVEIEMGSLFVENDTKYAALGIRDRKGIKYAGWVVRIVDGDGAVLAVQGSRPPLIALVK